VTSSFTGQVDLVAANVDGDHYLMTVRTAGNTNFRFYGSEMAELTIDGRHIAMQHYPRFARGLATSGAYDAVFYGHDHQCYVEQIALVIALSSGKSGYLERYG